MNMIGRQLPGAYTHSPRTSRPHDGWPRQKCREPTPTPHGHVPSSRLKLVESVLKFDLKISFEPLQVNLYLFQVAVLWPNACFSGLSSVLSGKCNLCIESGAIVIYCKDKG